MKFKKLIYFLIVFTFFSSILYSEDLPVLAVPTIEGTGVSESISATCRNILETALIKTGVYSVMNYSDVKEILEAQAFSLSGCTDESCAIEIGELLSAEKIVVGEISSLGEGMMLTIRLLDVSKGRI